MTQMKDEHNNNVNIGECMVTVYLQIRKRTRLGQKTVIWDGVLVELCGWGLGKRSSRGAR